MSKGKFWNRTAFYTDSFNEAILWQSILSQKRMIFVSAPVYLGDGKTVWRFEVNVNSLLAEDLVKEEGFHSMYEAV